MTCLHPQLEDDCLLIGRFSLCQLLLLKDANYPWFILVPDRVDVTEIYQLSEQDQQQLVRESSLLANTLMTHYKGDKMNIAALGNVVSQLHVHHIVRYRNDAAWPAPVWGFQVATDYSPQQIRDVLQTLKKILPREFKFAV